MTNETSTVAARPRHVVRNVIITLLLVLVGSSSSGNFVPAGPGRWGLVIPPAVGQPPPAGAGSASVSVSPATGVAVPEVRPEVSGPKTTTVEASTVINVRQPPSGLVSAAGDGHTDDTSAIQAMDNALASSGGGELYFPPGTYAVHGLVQDSGVSFTGEASTLSRLVNDTPTQSTPLIRNRVWTDTTSGSIAAGSNVLTVANTSRIAPGVIVAVKAAGGADNGQTTALRTAVSPSSTAFDVASTRGSTSVRDSRILIADKEIVSYGASSDTANEYAQIRRGLYGSRSVDHAAGSAVSQALRLVAEVVSVSGRTVTLDRPARLGVAGAPITVGSIGMKVSDLTIDGGGSNGSTGVDAWPVYYALANNPSVERATIENGEDGGIRLDAGTRDATITDDVFRDNGGTDAAPAPTPAHIWIFRGSERNTVSNNLMSGRIRWGIYVDDRTTHSTEYDGPSDSNAVGGNNITFATRPSLQSVGLTVSGSNGNVITSNTVLAVPATPYTLGVVVGSDGQGLRPRSSSGNWTKLNLFSALQIGIRATGIGTGDVYAGNVMTNVKTACQKQDPYGTYSGNGSACPDSSG